MERSTVCFEPMRLIAFALSIQCLGMIASAQEVSGQLSQPAQGVGVKSMSLAVVNASPSDDDDSDDSSYCPMQFPSQDFCAVLHRVGPIVVNQEAKFHLQFRSTLTGHAAQPVGDVSFYLWMPAMGHGSSPVTITASPGIKGGYDISKAFFVMAGAWEAHVELKSGASDENQWVDLAL